MGGAGDDRRKSCRFLSVGQRRTGKLRIGSHETTAEILDESAGGLSLIVSTGIDISVGQHVLLQSESLWLEIQVANLQSVSETQLRLGVMRLRELDDSEVDWDGPTTWSWTDFKTIAAPLQALVHPLATIVGLILGVPLALVVLIWVLDRSAPLLVVPSDDTDRTDPQTLQHIKPSSAPRSLKHLDTVVREIDRVAGSTGTTKEPRPIRARPRRRGRNSRDVRMSRRPPVPSTPFPMA